jgi:hypothetical protein
MVGATRLGVWIKPRVGQRCLLLTAIRDVAGNLIPDLCETVEDLEHVDSGYRRAYRARPPPTVAYGVALPYK